MTLESVPLGITVTARGWALSGEIDANGAPALDSAFETMPATMQPVVIDMGDVSFIDSSGLRVLARLLQRTRETQRRLILTRTPSRVTRLIEIAGMTDLIEIEADPEASPEAGAPG